MLALDEEEAYARRAVRRPLTSADAGVHAARLALYITYQLRAAHARSTLAAHSQRIAQGPPWVHERENTRRRPTTRRLPSPCVLQGFLYHACAR
jgi:hypothetical protein